MDYPYYCPRCDVYGLGDSCWMCSDHHVIVGPMAANKLAHLQRMELRDRADFRGHAPLGVPSA